MFCLKKKKSEQLKGNRSSHPVTGTWGVTVVTPRPGCLPQVCGLVYFRLELEWTGERVAQRRGQCVISVPRSRFTLWGIWCFHGFGATDLGQERVFSSFGGRRLWPVSRRGCLEGMTGALWLPGWGHQPAVLTFCAPDSAGNQLL
jgi:hypothetical protein